MHGQGVPHDRFLNTIEARSTVLPIEDEAIVVAFRRYTLLPLDDCLYMRAANGDGRNPATSKSHLDFLQ